MSFLGIEPGQGAFYAMKNHLRIQHEREMDHKPHDWIYSGTAGILLEHGKWFTGRVLPPEYAGLRGPEGRCHDNTVQAGLQARSLRAFTGLYSVGPSELRYEYHSWLIDSDGVVEVTFPTYGTGGYMSDGRGGTVPWLPPEHWIYVGLEFDVDYLLWHEDWYGLPVFDWVGGDFDPEIFRQPYTRTGVKF